MINTPSGKRSGTGRRGFTLAELCVVAMLLGIFSTAALASLSISLRQWRTLSAQMEASSSCRIAMNLVTNELRQAASCRATNVVRYYHEGEDAATTVSTAVLEPYIKNATAERLVFTEPNPDNFDPLDASFTPSDGTYYRKVTYYVKNDTELHRKVESLSTNGTASQKSDDLICVCKNISLKVTCLSAKRYQVTVECSQTANGITSSANLSTVVVVLGA